MFSMDSGENSAGGSRGVCAARRAFPCVLCGEDVGRDLKLFKSLPTFSPHSTQGNALCAAHTPRLPPALFSPESMEDIGIPCIFPSGAGRGPFHRRTAPEVDWETPGAKKTWEKEETQ